MKNYQFHTNINCSGCVGAIAPHFNNQPAISSWKVDTAHPQKILSVATPVLTAAEVQQLVQKAGYKANLLP